MLVLYSPTSYSTSIELQTSDKYSNCQLITAKENSMFSINIFRRNPRRYSNRLPPKLARRAMLSVRIHEAARRTFGELADREGKSVSAYVSGVLEAHLRDVAQQNHINRPSWGRP